MSANAKTVLDEFRKLPASEQQELLQQMPHLSAATEVLPAVVIPTIRVNGGIITPEHVADE